MPVTRSWLAGAAATSIALFALCASPALVAQAASAKSIRPVPLPTPSPVLTQTVDPTWVNDSTGTTANDWLFGFGCNHAATRACAAAGFVPTNGNSTNNRIYFSTNYTSWTIGSTPTCTSGCNTPVAGLDAVACSPTSGDTECMVAGGGGYVALLPNVATTSGWVPATTGLPATVGGQTLYLYAATCWDKDNCYVAGQINGVGHVYVTSNLSKNGPSWSEVTIAGVEPVWTGISCSKQNGNGSSNTGACMVVGQNASYNIITVAGNGTGVAGATQTVGNGFPASNWLNAVDCQGGGQATNPICYAAGDGGYVVKFTSIATGTTPSTTVVPPTVAGTCTGANNGATACTGTTVDLLSAGCGSNDNCSFGGYSGKIVTTENGTSNTDNYVVDQPPTSDSTSEIDGLQCPALSNAQYCFAVGQTGSSGGGNIWYRPNQ